MTDSPSPRPGVGQWLLLMVLAIWLAVMPLVISFVLAVLNNSPPGLLVELGLVAPGSSLLPEWAVGLFATALTRPHR